MLSLPAKVQIVEVGPRDGLQNIKNVLSTETKLEYIKSLAKNGLTQIEVGSFVSSKIPQMTDTGELLDKLENVNFTKSIVIPNIKGLERAKAHSFDQIALLAAASETFSQKNTGCSIDEGLKRCETIIKQKPNGVRVRAYVSCAFYCPYEGKIDSTKVQQVTTRLIDMGCDEVSISDTIGQATPQYVTEVLSLILERVSKEQCAVHFHNTYGQALANILASLQLGIATIDSATAGLGGCPYAKGAAGNIATEDVLFMLEGLGLNESVDLQELIKTGNFISEAAGVTNQSKVAIALNKH